jgi:glycosyltransferase involved in cell wall biosynthesis
LHFADLVNKFDFIDVIVRRADTEQFWTSVATLGRPSNIADPGYKQLGVPVWNLQTTTRVRYPLAVVRLARLLKRYRIDIVHAHHYEPVLIATLATMLVPSTRLIVGRHYSDAIYLHTRGLKRRAMLWLEAMCNRRAATVVAPSRMIVDILLRQRVPTSKIVRIPYAFESEKFKPGATVDIRSELQLSEDRRLIGVFSRLYSDKGHRHLIAALSQVAEVVPTVVLLVVGDGAEESVLARQVSASGLEDHVRFLGWRVDSLALMEQVELVVHPTMQEAFSQGMVEALWIGRPLVISDVSGVRDVVEDGVSALVVPPADPDALAAAIVRALLDYDLRDSMAMAGAESVRRVLSVESVLPIMENLYHEVGRSGAEGRFSRGAATPC